MNWLTDEKLPIGAWAKSGVDWLTDNGAWFFDGLSAVLEAMIDAILAVLQAPPPLVAVLIAALPWLRGRLARRRRNEDSPGRMIG